MISWPYATRLVPKNDDSVASHAWNTKPITEYCRNQATIEARPTTL